MKVQPDDRHRLLKLAREAVAAQTRHERPPVPPLDGVLGEPRGAFVTLHVHGELRGCIGHIEADEPLARVVARCAVHAASADPRFPPIAAGELITMEIELSLLTAPEPLESVDDIVIGRDGLIVEQQRRRGLLLPQVAVEHGWDVSTFLARTCEKAGLARDAWRTGARIWRFEADVFAEAR
jgi:AmmeMemoRadiSam system protein A